MIEERSQQDALRTVHAFSTFFLPKILKQGPASCRRWTRGVDIFAKEYLIIPAHWLKPDHWCLVVVTVSSRQLSYYDSLGGSDRGCLRVVAGYLKDEYYDKKGVSSN